MRSCWPSCRWTWCGAGNPCWAGTPATPSMFASTRRCCGMATMCTRTIAHAIRIAALLWASPCSRLTACRKAGRPRLTKWMKCGCQASSTLKPLRTRAWPPPNCMLCRAALMQLPTRPAPCSRCQSVAGAASTSFLYFNGTGARAGMCCCALTFPPSNPGTMCA